MKARILSNFFLAVLLSCVPDAIQASLEPTSNSSPSFLVQAIRDKYCATLTIDKTGPASIIEQGTDFDFVITVTNNSRIPATGLVLTDILPTQFTYSQTGSSVSNGGTISATGQSVTAQIGTLAPGAVVTVTIRVEATNLGEAFNTATVTSANAGTVSDTEVTVVTAAP